MSPVERARAVADEIRPHAPDKAAEIDRAIAEFEGGQRASLNVSASVRVTVQKYDGEYSADKTPVETIVREGSL